MLRRWAPVIVAVAAVVAAVVRWAVQDSRNVYTALAKRFYVPDPDLGWRVSTQHPIWLGLDACAVLVVLAIVTLVLARRASRILRAAAWVLAVGATAIPIVAFASGPGPRDARDTLPPSAAVRIETGIEGSLDAPAGSYAVVPHAGTSITARLSAGGEAFDARFASDITGTWDGDPTDLRHPVHAEISVAAAAVDTGIDERTKHAREGYLKADRFPRIRVTLDKVIAVRATGPQELLFRAAGVVELMGRTHAVEITGALQKPDAAALARLGLRGDVLLVKADFSLVIAETALARDAGDFDGDRIPIHVSLVLQRRDR